MARLLDNYLKTLEEDKALMSVQFVDELGIHRCDYFNMLHSNSRV